MSNYRLHEHPLSQNWLSQFGLKDQAVAAGVLRSLTLVSHRELWRGLVTAITDLPLTPKSRVALFPVTAPPSPFRLQQKFTSADRIGHSLAKFAAEKYRRYIVEPSTAAMKAERTKDIVLIDDYIGSGTRLASFLKIFLTPTIKSWLSFGYSRLWVVAYAVDPAGSHFVSQEFRQLSKDRFHYCQLLPSRRRWPDAALAFFDGIALRTSRPHAAQGYRQRASAIVFEHGCPNTAPAALWSNGPGYSALFPERNIPIELGDCFSPGVAHLPDVLWGSGQWNLALKLADKIAAGKVSASTTRLLSLIALSLKGVKAPKLPGVLMVSAREVKSLLKRAEVNGLTDSNGVVTAMGRTLIAAYRRKPFTPAPIISIEEAERFYYPSSYRGSAKI